MMPSGFAAASLAALSCSLTRQTQHVRSPKIQLINLSSFCGGRQATFSAAQLRQSSSAAVPGTRRKTWLQEVKGWSKIAKQLSKARLSALVVSTTAVGFIAGSEEQIAWQRLAWTAVGTFGASACANTLNQIYEVVNDGRMSRTKMRPLPLGRISRLQALAFAGVMGVGGTAILNYQLVIGVQANGLTAGLGVANILLYAGVYTPMKVFSASNTWVGAVVGGIPPLMGWTAASGSLEPGAAVLAAALYFWQIPHFLALAWLYRDDYMRGGYAMLSRFDLTGRRTASCALRNSLYMLPIGVFAVWVGTASLPFAYEAAIGAGTLATTSAIFYQTPTLQSARTLFRFSILFLPAFMLGLVVHRVPNEHTVTFASLQEKLVQAWNGETSSGGDDPRRWPKHQYPAVPIPFLPAPLQLRCQAKIQCESKSEVEGGDNSS